MAQDILSSGLLRGANILQASSQHDIQQQKLGLLRSEQTAEEEKRKQDARFKSIDDLGNFLSHLVNEPDMFDKTLAQMNKLLGEAGVGAFQPGENRKEFAAALAKRDSIPKSQQASYLKMLQEKYGHRKDFAQQTEQLEKDVTREKDLTEKIAEEGRAEQATIEKERRDIDYTNFYNPKTKDAIALNLKTPEGQAQAKELVSKGYIEGKIPTSLVNINLGKPASASERTSIAENRAAVDSLNNLNTLFKTSYVGPIAGRAGTALDIFGGNKQARSEFIAATAAFKNQVIKEITGAQMSEPEAKRIMKQIPDVNNPPSVWKARHKQSIKNLVMLRKRKLEVLAQSGMIVPGGITINDIGGLSDEELEAIISQGE